MNSLIPLKQWISEEAIKLNISRSTMNRRFYGGKTTKPFMLRKSKRTIYVVNVDESLTVASTC